MPRTQKKICHCTPHCNQKRSRRTRDRHYSRVQDRSTILPSESDSSSDSGDDSAGSHSESPEADCPFEEEEMVIDSNPPLPRDDPMTGTSDSGSDTAESTGFDTDSDQDKPDRPEDSSEEWQGFDEYLDRDTPISLEEMVRQLEEMVLPDDETALYNIRNDVLTERDRDNIRAFNLKVTANMPRAAFDHMRYAFDHKMDIGSQWALTHRMAILSGVEPEWYHCCTNSCLAFIGPNSDLTHCSTCNEPRYTPKNKPRRLFCYIPIIPRLQGYFMHPKMSEQLLYRHNYRHVNRTIADIFDSIHYRTLCKQHVEIDGKKQPHKYFDSKYDIALGICLDSFLLFKRNRKGPSATPILALNYNLPPSVRTHVRRLICAGLIPGVPKDCHSFLIPFDNELAKLAFGVDTYSAVSQNSFLLRAYNLFKLGDIISIEKMLNIKGHNGLCPCRSCQIRGVRNIQRGDTIYYVPLTQPSNGGEPESWDPRNLPPRSHEDFARVNNQLDLCATKTARNRVAKEKGIKGLPALRRVRSMDFARSSPWDGMHLHFENIVPNLYKLWSGKYKGLDSGVEDYIIPDEVWTEIWKETADAVEHLPADFVRKLGDIPGYFTAEAWCFWIVHLAPVLLEGRFPDPKYHTHLCQYSNIVKRCIGFVITFDEINDLHESIIDWVRKYEEYYYQHDQDRLSACPLTIHGLLHIAEDIRFCGPSWTTWTFWVERYCGFLQASINSKRFPFANMNQTILNHAYLEQLEAKFDLDDELSRATRRKGALSASEHSYPTYPLSVLRLPYRKEHTPDLTTRKRIAGYFANVLDKTVKDIRPHLPESFSTWGKVRIIDGDSIRCASALGDGLHRNNSFVRYEVKVPPSDNSDDEWPSEVSYGRLEDILVCKIPEHGVWGPLSGKTSLLAIITPCKTDGKDAAAEITSYIKTLAPTVTDLCTIVAAVGRVQTRGRWVIIDRTGGLLSPKFTDEGEEE